MKAKTLLLFYTTVSLKWKPERIKCVSMPTELDQDPILSAMRAKMRHLEASMNAYMAFLGGTDLPTGEVSQTASSGSTDVPDGAFHGKTIPAAVKLLLSIVRKKLTTSEIVAALKKGGMESTSKRFSKIVRSTLNRMWTSRQEVIKTGGAWALPEFFSPQVRASFSPSLGESTKQPRSKKRAKKTSKKAPTQAKQAKKDQAPAEPPASAGTKSGDAGGTMSRIEALLREHPEKEYTAQQVATATKAEKLKTAQLLLGRLVSLKKAEKTATGKYRARQADAQSMPVAS